MKDRENREGERIGRSDLIRQALQTIGQEAKEAGLIPDFELGYVKPGSDWLTGAPPNIAGFLLREKKGFLGLKKTTLVRVRAYSGWMGFLDYGVYNSTLKETVERELQKISDAGGWEEVNLVESVDPENL